MRNQNVNFRTGQVGANVRSALIVNKFAEETACKGSAMDHWRESSHALTKSVVG